MSELPIKLDIAASAATFEHFEDFTQNFNGRKLWKTKDDLERYARVIRETKPELIIETGTRWGGSAEWMAVTFDVHVITVDIQRITSASPLDSRITEIIGSSIYHTVVEDVAGRIAGRRTMVSLDSDHHFDHVVGEIRAYAPFVSPGCYLVVEDGIADVADISVAVKCGQDIPRTGGPLKAITQELVGREEWTRDREIEDMTPISHHVAGWWRRDA